MSAIPDRIILASASPRRKELLGQLFDSFEILVSGVDEESLTQEDPRATSELLAKAKAEAVAEENSGALVIGADTVVAYEEDGRWHQLAKPADAADAMRMLSLLSGRDHQVITAVALVWSAGTHVFSDSTDVRFRDLTQEVIEAYVATGEPMDKAGAYGLQGGAASFATISGSWSNVVGLPMERLEAEIHRLFTPEPLLRSDAG